jgi:sulfatase maturation enzyme AslB (radical SAM superfamily)
MSIQEWIDSDELAQIQQSFKEGKPAEGCQFCVRNEAVGAPSTRLRSIDDYADVIYETKIDTIDYRANNLCNYKCRSCHAGASSAWLPDVKSSDLMKKFHPIIDSKVISNQEKNRSWILKNISNLCIVTFAGGEPTIISEIKDACREIAKNRSKDLRLVIITNGSVFDDFWQSLTAELGPNLVWCVSLDAVGPAAEVIRNGTKWHQVEKNIHDIAEQGHALVFNSTISNLNLFHLDPLQDFIRELRDFKKSQGKPGIQTVKSVWMPKFMNPYNWPEHLSSTAIEYLENTISKETYADSIEWLSNLKQGIIDNDFNQQDWDLHLLYNRELDRLRLEKFEELYPRTKFDHN